MESQKKATTVEILITAYLALHYRNTSMFISGVFALAFILGILAFLFDIAKRKRMKIK
jgi:hypothetical protein